VFITNTGSLVIIILSIWNQLTKQSINTYQDEPYPLSVKACFQIGNKT